MKNLIILSVCLLSPCLHAGNCEYEKRIDQTLDLSASSELVVNAGAGSLEVNGTKSGRLATIKGRVCVSQEDWLDQSVVTTHKGQRAEITVELPEADGDLSFVSRRYAYLDLELEVPNHVTLKIRDGAGNMMISDVGAVNVEDSSGDIEIEDSMGPVVVKDSSGDIQINDITTSVTIESDGSGDIEGENIYGSVLVGDDSSGDIQFENIGRDLTIERDSTGDIHARKVLGNFHVISDSSGKISSAKIMGDVILPDDRT